MQTRTLGRDLTVSAIGFGCMGLSHASGEPTDIDEAAHLLREAVDQGYTFFDTAKNYGFAADPHHNEKILGKAFAGIRDQVVIASKTGVDFDYAVDPDVPPLILNSTRENIRASLEGTLTRLGTDHLDLYFQARVDPNTEPEDVAETMAELIREGKILHWGISEASEEYLRRANAVCPLTAVELKYNMVERHHEDKIAFLEENHIGWVAYTPMCKGLLGGGFSKGTVFRRDDWRSRTVNDENIDKYADLTAYLRELASEKDATVGQISIAWVLAQKPYIVPIPGMRRPERLAENAGALDVVLTAEELAHIDELLKQAGEPVLK